MLSAFANRYIRAITRLTIRDCTSGFRCWRREALERLPLASIRSDGYAFIVELAWEASRARLRMRRGADHVRRAARGRVEALERRDRRVGDAAVAAALAARPAKDPALPDRSLLTPIPRGTVYRSLQCTSASPRPPGLSIFFPAYNDGERSRAS